MTHQIVLRKVQEPHGIMLSCTCRVIPRRGRPGYEPIAVHPLLPAGEAIALWEAWHEQQSRRAA